MFVLVLRTVFIYCIIVFSMRLMGKKQLGELQPSELVSTILISNLASICIESPEIPIAGSLVPVLMIVSMEILVSALSARRQKLSAFLSGNPKILIRRGVIDQDMLRRLRFSTDDVLEALRGKDIFELEDVELAIVETNGTISVSRRPGAEPVTLDDIAAEKPQDRLPRLPVIVQGELNADALACLELSEEEVTDYLKKQGCDRHDVLLLLCNEERDYQMIRAEKRYGKS